MSKRRVVITGLGIVSPVGNDIATAWANILAGRSGITPIDRFDTASFPTHWINSLFPHNSVPSGLATMSLAVAVGLALGSIRIKGVRLGVAAVLFAGLLFGQLGLGINQQVLQYFRDFGLVLFVYAIGMQLGPGFLASLRAEGLRLNLLAISTLLLGALMAAGICLVAHLPREIRVQCLENEPRHFLGGLEHDVSGRDGVGRHVVAELPGAPFECEVSHVSERPDGVRPRSC